MPQKLLKCETTILEDSRLIELYRGGVGEIFTGEYWEDSSIGMHLKILLTPDAMDYQTGAESSPSNPHRPGIVFLGLGINYNIFMEDLTPDERKKVYYEVFSALIEVYGMDRVAKLYMNGIKCHTEKGCKGIPPFSVIWRDLSLEEIGFPGATELTPEISKKCIEILLEEAKPKEV